MKKLKNEIRVGKSLHHDNIVKYLDYKETKDYLFILMEKSWWSLRKYMNIELSLWIDFSKHKQLKIIEIFKAIC